jgi:hypothetical protein
VLGVPARVAVSVIDRGVIGDLVPGPKRPGRALSRAESPWRKEPLLGLRITYHFVAAYSSKQLWPVGVSDLLGDVIRALFIVLYTHRGDVGGVTFNFVETDRFTLGHLSLLRAGLNERLNKGGSTLDGVRVVAGGTPISAFCNSGGLATPEGREKCDPADRTGLLLWNWCIPANLLEFFDFSKI